MEDRVQEIDVVRSDSAKPKSERHRSQRLRTALLAGAFLAFGLVLGVALSYWSEADPTAQEAAEGTRPSGTTTQAIQAPQAVEPTLSPTQVPAATPAALALDTEPEVRLLDQALELHGTVVLAAFAPFGEPQTVWVVEPERLISRPGVPLVPGDWPNYVISTGAHIAFTSPPDAYVMPLDLSETPIGIAPARYIVPGATAGVVWAINDKITTATPIDMETGEAGEAISLGGEIAWVASGVADGFLVTPKDRETHGSVAFLAPDLTLARIEIPSPLQSGIHGSAADIVVVVSPGPQISARDITNDDLASVSIDIGSGLVSTVCLSPTQRYAVIVGSTTRSVVVDFEVEQTIADLTVTQEFQAVGWTSHTQLVYIDDDKLVALDVSTGERHEIAEIEPSIFWTVAASAAMC